MAAEVIIYSKAVCPYCIRAKRLFDSKGVTYQEIMVDTKPDDLKALIERTGWRTVPQIFINGEFLGGYQDIADLDAKGELDKKLQPA